MFPVPSPHFRSDCLTARMRIRGGQFSAPTYVRRRKLSNPSLTFSTEILFEQAQRHLKMPYSLYEGNPMTIRVTNALVCLVHGGRGMEDSKQFKDPKNFNKSFSELLKLKKSPIRRRNIKKIASATECGQDEVHARDEWKWVGDHILERIHNVPRREMFVPSDCHDCPCDHRLIQDWRENSIEVPVECEDGQE